MVDWEGVPKSFSLWEKVPPQGADEGRSTAGATVVAVLTLPTPSAWAPSLSQGEREKFTSPRP
ncbi:MAG: hypothetical protein JWL96_335, partial [Sphingomonas bacterium]|nr:hypothetical protein [Sphingomonas bacterium]